MSARKIDSAGTANSVTVDARKSRLTLSRDSVVVHSGGIEFRSASAFAPWTEMTINLKSGTGTSVHCNGVVISCTGNRHSGYHVSMVFTDVSRQARARLTTLSRV